MASVLELNGLTKRYGATTALLDVSFEVARGSTHAIIGENGAGKSTLIRILSGLETPDTGTVMLGGSRYRPGNLTDSRRLGVSTAFQDLSLLPNLTVSENLLLPRLGSGPFIRRRANHSAAASLLLEHGLDHIDPGQEVATLPLADKQKIEIVRAVSRRPKLLLLDEPSAALPDVDWLYQLLDKIRTEELTVLYISHRLSEIRDLCQTATVLRNGRVIDTVEVASVDDTEVFAMMGGTKEGHGARTKAGRNVTGTPALSAHHLHGKSVSDVTFTLHRGEIVGVAALEGQGQGETFRILAGASRQSSGHVEVDGHEVNLRTSAAALKRGISFVAEERKTEGIFPGLSTLANVTIGALDQIGRGGVLAGTKEHSSTRKWADEVELDERYLRMDIDALSGGNQQKAILARSLMRRSKYLLLYDPSRGVDVGTKATMYDLMERFVADGEGAILWYSTDLVELIGVCDRILCFYRGAVVAELPGEGTTIETLVQAITGHSVSGIESQVSA